MSDATERLNAALAGRYAIERELGEGGMATVYLAEDLRHNRKVALKVLKPDLAAVVGAERFLAEITTTANLTHPHILPLFDSGEADSFLFYVMPYLEGETLRDRIDREKQLPVNEAVRIATAVANALDHAHRNEVIHRDIKPANILLQDGEPVISDFGIALALGVAGGTRLTETGLSVGTPYYMSPEQATGDQAVGASTDTYALGSVLYEMLVGDPPFAGSTAQAVLGKIIAGKSVSVRAERPSVPVNVDAAVRKALEKLPADRFSSAQGFAKALGDEHFRYGELATAGEGGVVTGPWKQLTMAFAGVAALLAVAFAWSLLRPDPPGPVTRVSVRIPEEQFFHPTGGDLDLSSDGALMVYRGADDEGGPMLWARRWNALDATVIRGTERASYPTISPDGREVAFSAAGSIRVASIQGGVLRTLVEGGLCCPAWSSDGAWVYYADPDVGLSRVPVAGGSPEIVTELNIGAGDQFQRLPDVLPSGRGVVFTTRVTGNNRVQAVDVESGEVRDLTPGTYPRYSLTGHLLFMDDDATLLAAPFDVDALELTGAAVPVAEGVALETANGNGFYAASETGTLVYLKGSVGVSVTPVWVERDGTAREVDPGWTTPGNPTQSSLALSPNEDRLAISILDSEGVWDLWVKRLDTGPLSRLTFEGPQNRRATWSPDGQSLTFVSTRGGGGGDLWTKRADGSGPAELLIDREGDMAEGFYSPDGMWLVSREGGGSASEGDIFALRPGVDSEAVSLVATEFGARSPALSPDGRWLAYVSNEAGREDVYVRPFPDTDSGRTLVSPDGGVEPVWAHSGRELFYRNGADELVAVRFSGDPTFTVVQQDVLFPMAGYLPSDGHPMYDVSSDDLRFVMLRIFDDGAGAFELILVENWAEELR